MVLAPGRRLAIAAREGLAALAVSLIAAPLLVAQPSAAPSPDELFGKGVALHQSGDTLGAIKYYLNVLEAQPKHVQARSNLGAAYAKLGRYGDAAEQYRQALAVRPDLTEVRHNLGLALYKADRIVEAAAEFQAVVQREPKHPAANLLLADCYLKMGETQKIIDLLVPLEAELGEDRLYAYLLGTALIAEKHIERGQQVIDRLFRGGDSAVGHLLLGAQYLAAGETLKAQPELEKAIALNPELPMVHSVYAKILRQNRDHEGAAREFREELKRNPNDFDSNLWLGLHHLQEHQIDEAMSYLQRAERLRPEDTGVAWALGRVHLAANRLEQARTAMERVLETVPDYQPGHVLLAQVYYRLGLRELGDRERAIVQKLRAEEREKQRAAEQQIGPTTFKDEGGAEQGAE